MKVLLLENIHQSAVRQFERSGFDVMHHTTSLDPEKLIKIIADEHIQLLGIRSRTKLTADVLEQIQDHIVAIGCFCIGTNQVDLNTARKLGIPVFNSPFSNSRSVAELIIGQIINLSRRLGDANQEMHTGRWKKSSKQRREIRGKTLGIVGYGNIGSQVSVLAEAMGMNVLFYDITTKLPLGNANSTKTLDDLLSKSDFVTLHVPETKDTNNLIGSRELKIMKEHSYLLNASRGCVVNIDELADTLRSGRITGAYLDVFPEEPKKRDATFDCVLQKLPNVLMTPHIGGATEEAQRNIGLEVSDKLMKFIYQASTMMCVNLPNISLTHHRRKEITRIASIHRNSPGVLTQVNIELANHNLNIVAEQLGTLGEVGYVIVDVEGEVEYDILRILSRKEWNIKIFSC